MVDETAGADPSGCEPLGESRYLELTRNEEKGVIKVPVWSLGLMPLGADEWRLDYWFAAPLRMWIGPRAGDRNPEAGAGICRLGVGAFVGTSDGANQGANEGAIQGTRGRTAYPCSATNESWLSHGDR